MVSLWVTPRSGDSGRLGSSRRVGSSERSQGKVSGRAPLLLSSLSPRATAVFHKTKSNAGSGEVLGSSPPPQADKNRITGKYQEKRQSGNTRSKALLQNPRTTAPRK